MDAGENLARMSGSSSGGSDDGAQIGNSGSRSQSAHHGSLCVQCELLLRALHVQTTTLAVSLSAIDVELDSSVA